MNPLIRAENLGKCFKIYSKKWEKIRGALLNSSNHCKRIWAVRNVNLSIGSGTTLGVIGSNGSGKTTLLQLIAGLLKPSEGFVAAPGNMATLLDLGSGLQLELSGRENIFLTGNLRGFSKRELEKKIDDIVNFSELENFIEQPIKHYSSGMMMRLAFATAISSQPELLLIDEVFAVGDMAFQHKCMNRIKALQEHGSAIVLVSHDLTAIKSLCDEAILLNDGQIDISGEPEIVTNRYLDLVSRKISEQQMESKESSFGLTQPARSPGSIKTANRRYYRHGTGSGRVQSVSIFNSGGLPTETVAFGEEVTFRFSVEYFAEVEESGLGFYIRDRYGNDIIGINTYEENKTLGQRKKGDQVIVDFVLPILLRPGSYSVSPGLAYDRHEPRYLDWIDNAAFFQVEAPLSGKQIHGFVDVPNRVSVQVLEKDE